MLSRQQIKQKTGLEIDFQKQLNDLIKKIYEISKTRNVNHAMKEDPEAARPQRNLI